MLDIGERRRDDLSCNEPWVNFKKLSSLNEIKSLSSILGCEEKTEISSFSRNN